MSKAWVGKQNNMRKTKVGPDDLADLHGRELKLGQLVLGNTQSMVFLESEIGPYNMPPAEHEGRKFDKVKDGSKETKKRTKVEILTDIHNKTGSAMRDFKTVEEVHVLANEHNIAITVEVAKMVEGWVGKPKELLQILWERGCVDENNLAKYSMHGSKDWFEDDKTKKLKPQHEVDSRHTHLSIS